MNSSEVPLFLQHKLDQWETSIETFIRRQSEDELNNYMERLIRTLNDDKSSVENPLLSLLAIFGLTYVWAKVIKADSNGRGNEFKDENIDD